MGTVVIHFRIIDPEWGEILLTLTDGRVSIKVAGNTYIISKEPHPFPIVRISRKEKVAVKMYRSSGKFIVGCSGSRIPSTTACKLLQDKTVELVNRNQGHLATHGFFLNILKARANMLCNETNEDPRDNPQVISFLLATPSEEQDANSSDFRISMVDTDGSTIPVTDDIVCIGCGGETALAYILKHKKRAKTKQGATELVRDAVHWTASQKKHEISVGGSAVLWVSKVEKDSNGNRILVIKQQLTFPSYKHVMWLRCDDINSGISFPYISFSKKIYPLWDHPDAKGVLQGDKKITVDLIFYSLVTDNFFYRVTSPVGQNSCSRHKVTFARVGNSFVLGPDAKLFKNLLGLTNGTCVCIFWHENESAFVLWVDKDGSKTGNSLRYSDGGRTLRYRDGGRSSRNRDHVDNLPYRRYRGNNNRERTNTSPYKRDRGKRFRGKS